jgi:hypothetical protein
MLLLAVAVLEPLQARRCEPITCSAASLRKARSALDTLQRAMPPSTPPPSSASNHEPPSDSQDIAGASGAHVPASVQAGMRCGALPTAWLSKVPPPNGRVRGGVANASASASASFRTASAAAARPAHTGTCNGCGT